MRGLLAFLMVMTALTSACSSGTPSTFALASASVDPTYWCPGGAKDAHYDLHATIAAHNGTGKPVSIQSLTAVMTLSSVRGNWLERVGYRYDAGSVTFAPATVASRSSATVTVTIPSSCTSGIYAGEGSASADYQVAMRMVTSAGAYSITSSNKHEILAA